MLSISYKKSECKFFRLCILYNAVLWKCGRLMGRFQSRNRDAFHFKCIDGIRWRWFGRSFNLGIEMLFVSSELEKLVDDGLIQFQSRNRDAFRFKAKWIEEKYLSLALVSISESRCFSFQVCSCCVIIRLTYLFQSRNRDAFRFKCNGFRRHNTVNNLVSISESRCFSFQVAEIYYLLRVRKLVSISESRCFSFQADVDCRTKKAR